MIEQLSQEDFDDDWAIFASRVKGEYVGPMLSRTVHEYYENWGEHKEKLRHAIPQTPDSPKKDPPELAGSESKEETDEHKSLTGEVAKDHGDTSKVEEKFLEKPDSPSVLLCPMVRMSEDCTASNSDIFISHSLHKSRTILRRSRKRYHCA